MKIMMLLSETSRPASCIYSSELETLRSAHQIELTSYTTDGRIGRTSITAGNQRQTSTPGSPNTTPRSPRLSRPRARSRRRSVPREPIRSMKSFDRNSRPRKQPKPKAETRGERRRSVQRAFTDGPSSFFAALSVEVCIYSAFTGSANPTSGVQRTPNSLRKSTRRPARDRQILRFV